MTPVTIACLLNARGDYLLNLPALRALAEAHPGRLVLVVRRGAFETCLRDVAAHAVVEVDAVFRHWGYDFDAAHVAAAILEHGPVETFISLNPWGSEALDALVACLAPAESIGFAEGPWTIALDLDFSCHSSVLAFRTVDPTASAAAVERFAAPPVYPPRAARFARTLREDVTDGPLIVIHRDTKAPKQWRDDRWIALLQAIVARHPNAVIADIGLAPLTGCTEAQLDGHLLHGLNLPLPEAMALAGAADIFIGVDSCFLHAADLARVALVGLFFATDPHEFGALWAPHRHVVGATADDVTADAVLAAFDALFADIRMGSHRDRAPAETSQSCPGAVQSPLGNAPALGPVGLGTARWSFDCDLAAESIIAAAAAAGCNVIDLAGNHGGGDACAVVGAALARLANAGRISRDSLFLCGKAGFTEHLTGSALAAARGWDGGHCLAPDYLAWEFDRQRAALNVGHIDAFMLQNPEDLLLTGSREAFLAAVEDGFALFETWRAAGQLQIYGVSTAEALRVPRGHPLHVDLADLWEIAERVGGTDHGFRIIELPVNLAHLEAMSVAAHRSAAGDDLAALDWALHHGLTVLASAAIDGGTNLAAVSASFADIATVRDPAAIQLQLIRSLPGVTTALVGISRLAHLPALAELAEAKAHVW